MPRVGRVTRGWRHYGELRDQRRLSRANFNRLKFTVGHKRGSQRGLSVETSTSIPISFCPGPTDDPCRQERKTPLKCQAGRGVFRRSEETSAQRTTVWDRANLGHQLPRRRIHIQFGQCVHRVATTLDRGNQPECGHCTCPTPPPPKSRDTYRRWHAHPRAHPKLQSIEVQLSSRSLPP